jgi:hypothetical protein
MKIMWMAGPLIGLQIAAAPVWAADDLGVERMATCQDSWLDWQKNDEARLKSIGGHLRADFSKRDNDPFLVPKTAKTVVGLSLLEVFPQSVGMGVGFSVLVGARFDDTRRAVEKKLGKTLGQCETSDNMRTCGLEIGPKRTVVLMAEDNAKSTTTLLGCYYYYEK